MQQNRQSPIANQQQAQTPVHEQANMDLLNLIPKNAMKITEVGSSSGAMAREFKKISPNCHYLGIEIDQSYVELSKRHCDKVLHGSIENFTEEQLEELSTSDTWIFGDVLEHLINPWGVLETIKNKAKNQTTIVACIPNAQHWIVQASINASNFDYQDAGLFDRTHLRWFTAKTVQELFTKTGWQIQEIGGRVVPSLMPSEEIKTAIRQMAKANQINPETAVEQSLPLQWLIKASYTPEIAKQPEAAPQKKSLFSMNFKLS